MTSASGSLETFSSLCVMTLGAVRLLGATCCFATHRRHESCTSAGDELAVAPVSTGSTGRTSRACSAAVPKRLMTGVATWASNIQASLQHLGLSPSLQRIALRGFREASQLLES